ncbi:hypothetical protein GCM10020295_71670 [Streptomyces cinereospinus]
MAFPAGTRHRCASDSVQVVQKAAGFREASPSTLSSPRISARTRAGVRHALGHPVLRQRPLADGQGVHVTDGARRRAAGPERGRRV